MAVMFESIAIRDTKSSLALLIDIGLVGVGASAAVRASGPHYGCGMPLPEALAAIAALEVLLNAHFVPPFVYGILSSARCWTGAKSPSFTESGD